jgi:hypothetical protein
MNAHAVFLGWDHEHSEATRYTLSLPQDGLALDAEDVLVFDLAAANEHVGEEPIDLTLELADHTGEVARLPLSHVSYLRPQLQSQVAKAGWMNLLLPPSEVIFQTFAVPMTSFAEANPGLDPSSLLEVSFVFDRSSTGVVALNNVGFRRANYETTN